MGKILVTGANGLVGSQFNNEVIGITSNLADLRDKKSVDLIFDYYTKKEGVDKIIHCAAKVGGVKANMDFKGEFFYDNIMINTNVLESARTHGIKNVISFLSTCIFPDNIEYPLTEKKIHFGPPHTSNDAYAYAKRMLDIQSNAYREQYGLNYKCVIPTNIYGPYDNFNLNTGHVIPSLIHKCFLAKHENTPFIIWGSGEPLREFIYSEDVANLTLLILNNYSGNEPLILSNSVEISIKEIAIIIAKEFNFDGEIVFDVTKPDGQLRKPTDNTKLKSLFPEYKFTNIEDGIKKTVKWFIKNYPNVKL